MQRNSFDFDFSLNTEKMLVSLMRLELLLILCGRSGLQFMILKILNLLLFYEENHMAGCSGDNLLEEEKELDSFGRKNGEESQPISISFLSFPLLYDSIGILAFLSINKIMYHHIRLRIFKRPFVF